MTIRTLQPSEESPLAEALAEAFRDNPLNCAVIGRGPRARFKVNRAGMRLTLDSAREGALILIAMGAPDELAGGLIGIPPGGWPLPPPSFSEQLMGILHQGIRVTHRWGRVYDELAERHPLEPHWYLSTLGIRPEFQGRGLASGLLDCWLREVDGSEFGAYLETDHPESLSFYLKRGFRICEECHVFGVPIWRMSRVPGFLSS